MNYITYIVATVIVLLNIYATVRLWRSDSFNQFQKTAQSVIVWLLPVVGAVMVIAFIKEDETPKGPDNPNNGQGVDGVPGGVQ